MFTLLLLLGSVSSATTITEPGTFTTTAHSTTGTHRTITFNFTSDVDTGSTTSDTLTITHSGSGTFCVPAGTTTFGEGSESPFTFTCPGFQFNTGSLGLISVQFLEPNGTLSDSITIGNDTSGGSSGTFASGGAAVAEPAGLAVLGSGLLILAGVLRRRIRNGTPPNSSST
jgi:hypothetical protein